MSLALVRSFRCPVEHWQVIATWLLEMQEPWPPSAAILDLRFWAATTGEVPSIAQLQDRWAWGEHRVRALVTSTSWHDRTIPAPRRKGRIAVIRNGRTTTTRETARDRRGR